jgi:filamentous hemagglutinin family protein
MKKAVFPVTTAFLFTAARLISADLPSGGQVAAGSAAISSAGNTLTVTQTSAKAVINWQDFSVGAGHAVRFDQPNASSVTLNRVVGTTASLIDGALSANGRVFLVNPNGVIFGAGAQVEVGGLVASTLALRDTDFLAGNYVFDGAGAGIVANHGRIVAVGDGQGGFITMLAAQVVNEGTLQADRGSVALVAADRVTLDLGGLVGVTVERGSLAALVDNGGAIRADGGRVYLTARAADELASAAINHDGVIEARTLVTGEKGSIILLGDLEHGSLVADGRLDASAPAGGDGGFIETSAAQVSFGANFAVTTAAVRGAYGTWLLDPATIEIVAGSGGSVSGLPATGISQIGVTTLSNALATANVELQATAAIDLQTDFNYAGARDATLSLFAPTILIGGNISTSTNKLGLNFGGTFNSVVYAGNVSVYGADRTIATRGGAVVFNGNLGGGFSLSVATAGGNITTNAAVNGTFSSLVPVTGTLSINYQAGGPTQVPGVIDFQTQTITINGGAPNQIGSGNVFPSGTVTFPVGTVFDLNSSNSLHPVFTRPDGTTFTLTATSGGAVTFGATERVTRIDFYTKSSNWVTVTAANVTWKAAANATSLNNLTLDAGSGTVTLNAPLTVGGNITVNTGLFDNNAGAGALTVGTGKTWQVWSSNPAPHDPTTGDDDGNLLYDYKQYGATYGSTTPSGTGKGMFYAITPLATLGLTGSITKVYDGTAAAINLLNANYTISGGIDGDTVAKAVSMPASGSYADKNVGTGKTVTVTGLNSTHYTVTSSTGKPVYGYGLTSSTLSGAIGAITPKDITAIVGLTAQDKVYDGNTAATLNTGSATFTGMIGGDNLTIASATGTFADKNAGTGKTVNISGLTLGGTDLSNYNLVSANATTTASITKLRLTSLSGLTAENKVYDRTNGATLDVSAATFGGKVTGDSLSITAGSGTFADKNVGTGKIVTVAGLTFGGTDAGNYDLPLAAVTTSANITPKPITAVTAITAQDKVYDGNTSATLNTASASFAGLILGDALTVASAIGNFADKNAGTGKTVNITGLTLGGADLSNYSLVSSTSTTTANITKLRLTSLSGITAENKTYDRTDAATLDVSAASFGGKVTGDSLSITAGTGTFANRNVGTAKTVTIAGLTFGGTDAGNYDLPLAAVTTSANITPKDITAVTGILADDKVYDGNTSATLNSGSAVFAGLIAGDTLTVASATGNFVDKNVGTGKQVNVTGLTLGGAALSNYNLVSANSTTTASITKRTITGITGVTADGKVYDANATATLNTGGAVFGGRVSGDTLTLTGATGAFSDANAGNGKTVTVSGYSLGGTDAGNYEYLPTTFSVLANITRAPLSVRAADLTKAYDGVPFAGGNGLTFTGFVGGQGQGVLTGSPTFGGNSQGAANSGNYAITPGGFSSSNYALSFVSGLLTIGAGSPPPAAPEVDVRVFLPVTVLVPVLAVPPVAVRLPASPGGLNYVPASRPAANVVAFAPSPVSANATVSVSAPAGPAAVAVAPSAAPVTSPAAAPAAEATVTEAAPAGPNGSRRAQDGVTRSLMGPLDVIVVNGGVNLGVRPVVAE